MKVFKPVSGRGTIWGTALMLLVGAIFAVPMIVGIISGNPNPVFLITMGSLAILVLGMFGYFTWSASTMEYLIDNQELIIKWAFNQKIIPLDSIRGVSRTIGTSSLKVMGASWPGFHMGSFTNPNGRGSVNLYATRIWGDIILIRTKWEVIGITPQKSDEFLQELRELNPNLNNNNDYGDYKTETFSFWKDKSVVTLVTLTAIILIGTGLFLYRTVPMLPDQIPLHYNIEGQVDRYGAPNELYRPFGIGALVVIMLFGINLAMARNNPASVRITAIVSLLISLIFSIISIGMVLSV